VARIYISATYSDLIECRKAVYDALRSMKHDVIAMEDYVATDRRPLDKCLEDVGSCDLYIGIFAWRYGYVPTKDNPEQKSITELEFRHAAAEGIPRLLFLLDEHAPWPRSQMEQRAGAKKLKLLRDEISTDLTVSFFTSCEQLATKASAAVANWSTHKTPSTGDLSKPVPLTPDKISISRLPVTGRDLFGRDEKLKQLDEAWDDHDTHILSLVAWGGVGKSALVNHWVGRKALDDYRGAERVYAWSFYSQGTNDRVVSADQFIEAALTFFGDTDPNKGSPWDKGERLAQLVGAQRTLLVLDGLEPLQHPPGTDEGRIKDQALQSLLRGLAASNKGLCLISTRVAVADLNSFEGSTATRVDLEHLSPEAGTQVLTAQGVKGTQAELEQASTEFDGHSLALTLLGSYLSDVYGGDVSRRKEVSDLEGDVRYGGHAQRVMASYEKWFGEGPELSVLRMLGLFDRPADKDAIAALRAAPAIPGLTDALQNLSEPKWQQVLSRLRRAKLLAEPSPNQPGTLDTHPLVREHFGQQLKRTRPDAWREGNHRLYGHLTRTAKEFPATLEEMAPLYTAIAHGCEAGCHREALHEVYSRRIQRGGQNFSWRQLGVVGANLAVLSMFFDVSWKQPVLSLSKNERNLILSDAGFYFMVLGRFKEAIQPLRGILDEYVAQGYFEGATVAAGNLCEIYSALGDLNRALSYAQKSIDMATNAGDMLYGVTSRAYRATVLYLLGRIPEAEAAFREAERLQAEDEPRLPYLYSISGFWYCALLMDKGNYRAVEHRISRTYAAPDSLLDTALEYLSLGQAYLLQAQIDKTDTLSQATECLSEAMKCLRQNVSQGYLARGLLARAELYRLKGEFDQAGADLDETMRIAAHCEMAVHEADCHVEYTRLHLARGERKQARASWERARAMIERMGYHRRDRDVEELGRQLEGARD